MSSPSFAALRRKLVAAGGSAATMPAESASGRRDTAEYCPAKLLDGALRHVAVESARPWLEDIAFLDGAQHVTLLGYLGTSPVVAADVYSAIRRRSARRTRLEVRLHRRCVIGRRDGLAVYADDDILRVQLPDDVEPHPIGDMEAGRAAADKARMRLELDAAREFRRGDASCWLIVDGSLAVSPDLSRDHHAIGVVKSHAALPFAGDELATYLSLPVGHRTSVFQPQSHRVTPVHAWALRLHRFDGLDLFHGLVRIEISATDDSTARADFLSPYLLAERAPLSNDPRSDRLLYGIHDVERYLRASA